MIVQINPVQNRKQAFGCNTLPVCRRLVEHFRWGIMSNSQTSVGKILSENNISALDHVAACLTKRMQEEGISHEQAALDMAEHIGLKLDKSS